MKDFFLSGILLIFLSDSATCQERVNDKRPTLQLLSSITALVGWTKNDIGVWVSARNALKNYEHSAVGTLKICDRISSINLYTLNYRGKTHYCVVKFGTHPFVHAGRILTENTANYWVFDASSPDTVIGDDLTVMNISFNTVHSGLVSTIQPKELTINGVVDDIIVNFDEPPPLEGRFCVESRENKKSNTFQFLIGSYMGSIDEFQTADCFAPGTNNTLKNLYYEVPASQYQKFFGQIK